MESFLAKNFASLSEKELEDCSLLYSENYGKYSGVDDRSKKGKAIKMSAPLYKRLYGGNKNLFISMCHDSNGKLLGHAIFLKKDIPGKGPCSWVLQLVVHRQYRNRKIGSKLLQSAWGFSNYYAWGLATANAITLKTLESVTWREISVDYISKNISVLENLMEDVPFVTKGSVKLNRSTSQVFSNFYPELESSNQSKDLQVYARRLGKLKPGNEWLAFTFRDQKMSWTEEKFNRFLKFSEQQLKDAYSRMEMPSQPWTRGTANEIDFILKTVPLENGSKILDLGCGQGRHSIELAKRGFINVTGVDFAERNIDSAKRTAVAEGAYCNFINGDARSFSTGKDFKYNCVLCLYDVIGSFRDESENGRILKNIKQLLAPGGRAVISVMNMEMTRHVATNKVSLKKNPQALLALPPSETMKSSGNVFNPEYFLINTDDGVVYRKEQFSGDGYILAEYVVADRRYTMKQIKEFVQKFGFKITEARYVQAGKWDAPLKATDARAKEILLVLENLL